MAKWLLFCLLLVPIAPSTAYDAPVAPAVTVDAPEETADPFRHELVKAIRAASKDGTITKFQAFKLRIASLSPAFCERAEKLAVIQMVFSGESPESIPYNDDGTVNVAAIDWAGLTEFIKVFLPLLLELLASLGL